MGKYSAYIDKLPRHLGTEPAYQDRVNAVRQQIVQSGQEDNLTAEQIDRMTSLELDRIKHAFKQINEVFMNAVGDRKTYASQFAVVYRYIRKVKDELEAHESNINLIGEAYNQLLVDQFENEGLTSLTLDEDGSSVRVQYEPYAQVEDRDRFREWCMNNGLENQLALPWQTANSLCKARLVEGEPEPDGVKIWSKTKTVLTKARS